MRRSTRHQSVVNTSLSRGYSQDGYSRLEHYQHEPLPSTRGLFKRPLTMGEQAERELSGRQSRSMIAHTYNNINPNDNSF